MPVAQTVTVASIAPLMIAVDVGGLLSPHATAKAAAKKLRIREVLTAPPPHLRHWLYVSPAPLVMLSIPPVSLRSLAAGSDALPQEARLHGWT
jgi:hypothetical protein